MRKISALIIVTFAASCANPDSPVGFEGENADTTVTSFINSGSTEEAAVLALVNDPKTSFTVLDNEGRLDRRAALNIITHRDGPDGVADSADDEPFTSIEMLDAIPYVGQSALLRLLELAEVRGFYNQPDDGVTPADRVAAILSFVNSDTLTFTLLDDDVGLDARAARNIWTARAGGDDTLGTADDGFFRTLEDLDVISYVGERALEQLADWAVRHGWIPDADATMADVIMSPQLLPASHNARVAELIDEAEYSLDIAMYSFSDAAISEALERAVQRGIKVRFIFETANKDRRAADPSNTKSGRLEAMGINVRWVNKIMHHKFMIADGPRDVATRAETATLVTGSANWSWGAATRYDENTIFLKGHSEVVLLMQREFNHMWTHSRDFVYDDTLPFELSTYEIDDLDTDPATHGYFTSDNFSVSGDTFRIVRGLDTVADQLVAAIGRATSSIHVASGHLRSRKVAEALEAKHVEDPSIDIRIYLDGQEYVSHGRHLDQIEARAECLVEAGTSESRISQCYDKGFYYGYPLGEAGIPVRYKYYAYRWHYSYAVQMHHKFMIIDSAELWSGSYNLSDNAEHNTFENMLTFKGPGFASLIQSFETTFETMWATSRADDTYSALLDEVDAAAEIPLVFTPMALDWDEVTHLKNQIRDNCSHINSVPFRTEPESHRICER